MIRDTSNQDEIITSTGSGTRKYLIAGAILVGLAIIGYWTLGSWASAEQTISKDRVRIVTVTRGDLSRDISAQGSVVAAIKPTLFSPSDGVVTLMVNAGDQVVANQTIAQIDSPELHSLLNQESAALASAKNELKRQEIQARQTALTNQQNVDLAEVNLIAAKRELRRAQAARSRDAISEFDFDKANDDVATANLRHKHASQDAKLQEESLAFELETTRLNIQQQQLIVNELSRRVDELNIVSPVTGIVGNLLVDNKDSIVANQPILTVVDLTAFEVELQVPDSFASSLELGLSAEVNHQGRAYPATLVAVSPEVVNSQITAKVRFSGEVPANLRQNQRVTTRILLSSKLDTLMVERGPFLESSGGRYTYVVEGNLATKQPIQTGIMSVSSVEILSGLKEGQRVIVSNLTDFKDAEVVYLTN